MLHFGKTFFLMVSFLSVSPFAISSVESEINIILAHPGDPPVGVVFEVIDGEEDALSWALADIRKYAKILKKAFTNINIAVVSHGSEQFALMKKNDKKYASIHKQVKQLVNKDEIPVHVCGTHASWYREDEESFPDYVDVAPVGPAQINDYVNLGYTLVVMEKP